MKQWIVLIGILVAVGVGSGADASQLEKRALLGGRVEMLVPKHFKIMSEEMIRAKYPNERPPTHVLTDERGTFNIALNHTSNSINTDKLVAYHTVLEQAIRLRHPSAEWFRSELTILNGRDCFILEMLTPAIDTQVHNIMMVTSLDKRMLLISVNLTKELTGKWLKTARQMVESITIKR